MPKIKVRKASARVRALKNKKREERRLTAQKHIDVPGSLSNEPDSWGCYGLGICAKCSGDLHPATIMQLSCGHLVHNGCFWGKVSEDEEETFPRSSSVEGCGLQTRVDGMLREICPLHCGNGLSTEDILKRPRNGFLVLFPGVKPSMRMIGPTEMIPRRQEYVEIMYSAMDTTYMFRDMEWKFLPRVHLNEED